MNKRLAGGIVSLIFVVLTGCQQAEDLKTSANKRWEYLIDKNYEKAYEYLSPGYREIENIMAYQLRIQTAEIKVKWLKGTYISEQCTENACEVKIKLQYQYKFPRRSMGEIEVATETKENWIKLDGRWYLVPNETTGT